MSTCEIVKRNLKGFNLSWKHKDTELSFAFLWELARFLTQLRNLMEMSTKVFSFPCQTRIKKTRKVCPTEKRKVYYFTTGRNVSEEKLKQMEEEVLKPYRAALEMQTLDDVKKYWENEKNKKLKEKESSYKNHHTHRSRLNVLWKLERLFVPEKVELPGRSLTDDIDPTFFTIVSGRPIKEKKNLRKYLQDIRDCFMTRLTSGYYMDEILLMNEKQILEQKELNRVKENFNSCQKGFEEFLKENHESSSSLLETAREEGKKSKEKLERVNCLKEDLRKAEADVLVVEETWRSLRMFQKFLYMISPSEWRKVHDPYYGKEDVGAIASDPCMFDSFREFPGGRKLELDAKILKFQEDIKQSQPPALYFTDPQDILLILSDLERNNLRAFTHSKALDFRVEKMMAELEKVKTQFEENQKSLEAEIKYLEEMVEREEKEAQANELKMRDSVFTLFKDLITNEEYLSVTSYVEDAYEDAVGITDTSLNIVEMIKEIELVYENFLLALDLLPNEIMVRTTRSFYKEEKRKLKEAKEAEKKVHQMESLLKRLHKALTYPKKGVKERKIVPRSVPPEEIMFKYKWPKMMSKEERDHLFFFGRTPDSVRLHKPLCL